jgi:hypothetical protein
LVVDGVGTNDGVFVEEAVIDGVLEFVVEVEGVKEGEGLNKG